MPRWIFVEVWILASFLLSDLVVDDFGDFVFETISLDERKDHLHLAIAGGGSFSDMSKSLLARFECREFGGQTHPSRAKSVISPRLKKTVTPDTKIMVKEKEADLLQSLNPSTREMVRVSKRGERYFIPVTRILGREINEDDNGADDIESRLQNEILRASAEKESVFSYSSILAGLHQRLWKKSQNIQRKSKSGNGGTVLAEYIRAQGLLNLHWKPGILLFSSKSQVDDYADLSHDKFSIGNIVEIFFLTRVRCGNSSLSSQNEFKFMDVICKAGKGSGSFTGSDKMKHGVLHDILRRQVCLVVV
jgi:hypothetical protein